MKGGTKKMDEETQIKVEDLVAIKSQGLVDVKKHEGKKVKIEIIDVIDDTTDYTEGTYDSEGKYILPKYVEGLKRPVKKLRIATEVLEVLERDSGPLQLRV